MNEKKNPNEAGSFLTLTVPLIALLGFMIFTGTHGGTAAPIPAQVSVRDKGFVTPITVTAGTTVAWKNASGVRHSVVWDDYAPTTEPGPGANIGAFGESATWTAPDVTTATTYSYHCGICGPASVGKITVTP